MNADFPGCGADAGEGPNEDARADSGAAAPSLSELVAECADRLDREGVTVVDELCARNPEHAAALRSTLAPLLTFGIVGNALEADPSHVGGYAVIRRLGEGAFGIVYLCSQSEPIRREVAVKVLRPGAGDRSTLARFEAERQVLAMISHPAVASVFDAGVMPDGRPYFVMEYVDGMPVTEYCDRHRLGIEARLALFLDLCDGVQSAHQRGIIHRDLKPSNVLVVDQLGRPQPKVIDFGLAKALRAVGPEDPLRTELGRVLGTPGFMSPEQALGRGFDVDTRTDVFALGVVLYLLLTGAMPWAADRAESTTTAPPRPSTRATTKGPRTATIAAQRAIEPTELASRLRGDLDWIVLKALEPDRERRYPSLPDFAADLRRHLHHEPVMAGPPTLSYRLRKFVRRNRIVVLAAGAVLATLIAGLATAWGFAVDARSNLNRFQILAIDGRMRRATDLAVELHPSWPERLPAIDAWLAEHARPLAAELPRLRAELAELRGLALPFTESDREADRRSNSWSTEQANQQARLDYFEALLRHPRLESADFAELRSTLEKARAKAIEDLAIATERAGERRLWRFADDGQQFLHDTMTRLLSELVKFAEGDDSLVERVQKTREAIAEELHGIGGHRALWERAATEVAADPRYAALRLAPQAQLVPLGRDPASGLQEFLHVASAPPGQPLPSRDAEGRLRLGEDDGIVFVLLPGGEASLGAQRDDETSPNYDPDASITESPVHLVQLDAFFIGKHETTQAQWLRLTRKKPSVVHEKTAVVGGAAITRRHPVENLSWDDCQAELERHGLELPTEGQWEYACRAGTTTTWPTGAAREQLAGFALVPGPADDPAPRPAHHDAVGGLAPNGFGLHDMVGNVAEWCRDDFSSLAYLLPPIGGDGTRPVPRLQLRAVRGGSFQDPASEGSSAARNAKPSNHRGEWLGVRAVRRVVPAR